MASTRRTVSITADTLHPVLWSVLPTATRHCPFSSRDPQHLPASDPALRHSWSPSLQANGTGHARTGARRGEVHVAPPSHLISPLAELFFPPLCKR